MRAIVAMALSSLAVLSSASTVYGEPVTKTGISFSAPFNCSDEHQERCLGDKFSAGINVVLVSPTGNCPAKTGGTFTFEHPLGGADHKFPVTRLVGSEECLAVEESERALGRFSIAVVAAEPAVVRPITPKGDKVPIPKDVELKARRLARLPKSDPCLPRQEPSGVHKDISDAPPKVFRTRGVTLMILQCSNDSPEEDGPPILFMNDKVFRLCGSCTDDPLFFTVNDKLHLTYSARLSCCGCGDLNFFVYDLSGGRPKRVYSNGKFGD